MALAVLGLLSLGAHPLINGTVHPGVTLPWRWLESIPVLGSALPDRMSIIADGLAAALLAFCIDLVRVRSASVRWLAAGATAVAVLACLPLVPRPLPAASAARLPAGWSAAFAALRLPAQARVLVVPVPTATQTDVLRWQADTGDPAQLVGGYFVGPAWNGLAYIEGNGVAVTAQYLDELWSGGRVPQAPPRAQVEADLRTWQPAAVVAVTSPGSPLARYLEGWFGRPAISSGDVLAWRR